MLAKKLPLFEREQKSAEFSPRVRAARPRGESGGRVSEREGKEREGRYTRDSNNVTVKMNNQNIVQISDTKRGHLGTMVKNMGSEMNYGKKMITYNKEEIENY